jgi:hypothetical protein
MVVQVRFDKRLQPGFPDSPYKDPAYDRLNVGNKGRKHENRSIMFRVLPRIQVRDGAVENDGINSADRWLAISW